MIPVAEDNGLYVIKDAAEVAEVHGAERAGVCV